MIKHVSDQGNTPLDELLELITDVDDTVASADEREQLVSEIRSVGVSVQNRSRLAEMFAAQERFLLDEKTQQDGLIRQVNAGVRSAGVLTEQAQAERDAIIFEESKGIEQDRLEFQTALQREERFVLGKEENDAATQDANAAQELRKKLIESEPSEN